MSEKCAYQYTVKRGDSFYLIAHRLGVPLRDLLAANESIPPSRLTIGDVLCIPESESVKQPAQEQPDQTPENNTSSESPSAGEETQSPETDAEQTQETKPETKPETGTGQKPETGTEQKPDSGTEELCPATRRTVIQQGQSAGDLQVKYDLSYYTLQKANNGTDLETLKAGDVVCVPSFNVPCPLPEAVKLRSGETLESLALTYNLPISSLLRANPCLSPADFTEGAQIRLPK